MGHYASEMSSEWASGLERSERLARLRRAFATRSLSIFHAEDIAWLMPLMAGYPANEALYEKDLQKLEHLCEVNGWWARQDYEKFGKGK